MSDWKQAILESIESGSVEGMVTALDSQATAHAGTAPAKIKNAAVKLLRIVHSHELYPLILDLCSHENPTAQEIGAICITDFYQTNPSQVQDVLHRLADSEHWEVREWAASACGLILEEHFKDFLPILDKWSQDQSENVRRAVVLAVMYAGKSRNPEFIDASLELLGPLLSDQSRYVRDNLGPFAIGNALIKYYPMQVLQWLETWVQNDDEQIRWNIAMVFSAADGAKFAPQAESVIDVLLSDERAYVKKAVNKALKNIERRNS